MTTPNRAYEPITMYRTLDGAVHESEHAAQEHAEDAAGRALDVLLNNADPNMGHQLTYRIICHMLKNHQAYADALKGLHAFDPMEVPE